MTDTKSVTAEISASSHPEFDLFVSVMISGRQVARRGDRAEIDAFVDQLTKTAAERGVTVIVKDTTAPTTCGLEKCGLADYGMSHWEPCPGCGDTHRVQLGIPGRVMGGIFVQGASQERCRNCDRLLKHEAAA